MASDDAKLARNAYAREWYHKNRDRLLAKQRERDSLNKDANRAWRRAYNAANREVRNAKLREKRRENPHPFREADRQRRLRDPQMPRRKRLKQHFGMTVEQYDEMLTCQGGRCAACGELPNSRLRGKTPISLAVDHCHATGRVRGLLCANCNAALGMVNDDPEKLEALMTYLERFMLSGRYHSREYDAGAYHGLIAN